MSNSFPVSLDRYFFTKISVIANQDHIPEQDLSNGATQTIDVNVDSSLEVRTTPDNNGTYVAQQKVSLDLDKNPNTPYLIDIECIGMLHVDTAAQNIERGVTIVAHSVLYSAVREMVLMLTGRQAWGPMSLGLSVLNNQSPAGDQAEAASTARQTQ